MEGKEGRTDPENLGLRNGLDGAVEEREESFAVWEEKSQHRPQLADGGVRQERKSGKEENGEKEREEGRKERRTNRSPCSFSNSAAFLHSACFCGNTLRA